MESKIITVQVQALQSVEGTAIRGSEQPVMSAGQRNHLRLA